jgi:hypothetical protein
MSFARYFLLVGCIAAQSGWAQTAPVTSHQQGYWLRSYLRVKLTPRWTWHTEVDERRYIRPDKQWQLIAHQHLHYRIALPLEVALGGTYSRQPQTSALVLPEWRVFEEATYTIPISTNVRLHNRLRVEQRWLATAAEGQRTEAWEFRQRVRYRVQADWQTTPRWKLRAADELMLNTDSFDQNRVYAAAEFQVRPGLAAELGYLHIYQRRFHRAEYYQRDALRLTLSKDLDFSSSSTPKS